jgi:riboflavin transporter FmnP
MVRIGLLAGAGLILTLLEFPILPSAPFLKYDASEVPALLATFGMGPAAGVATEALKCVLFHFSGKNTTGIVGTSAMFVAGGTLVLVAGVVYSYKRSIAGAVTSLLAATVTMTAVMSLANLYVFLPLWGIPPALRAGLVMTAVLPFNLLKGLISAAITFFLYKRVSPLFKGKAVATR